MPQSRQPVGPFERRIDYKRIEADQLRRAELTSQELNRHFRRVERRTLSWVLDTLFRRKLKLAIAKFDLPFQAKQREILRRRMTGAAVRGADDVAGELEVDRRPFKAADLSRVRARADALLEEQVNWLETNLKLTWTQAMAGKIDRHQLAYLTQKVFADFAGWPEPKAP